MNVKNKTKTKFSEGVCCLARSHISYYNIKVSRYVEFVIKIMRFKKKLALYGIVVISGLLWWVQYHLTSSNTHNVNTKTAFDRPLHNLIGDHLQNTNTGTAKLFEAQKVFSIPLKEAAMLKQNRKPNGVPSSGGSTKKKVTHSPSKVITKEELDERINWSLNEPFILPNNSDASRSKIDHRELTVIIVPHSHTDPGWHETVEGYFSQKVESILDLVVKKLTQFPDMTFVWSETVFLHMWWKLKSLDVRKTFLKLVRSGRLEIVSGSLVMPDEAVTHYTSLVTTILAGHSWLRSELGITPKTSWSLDPFGYSATLPYLWSAFGIKNMYIQRISKRYKEYLGEMKMLEFYWMQFWDRNISNTDIFCSVAPYKLYNIDHSCGPIESMCNMFDFYYRPMALETLKTKERRDILNRYSLALVKMVRMKSSLFRHNVVLLPIGDDFRYNTEVEWDNHYTNFQPLIRHINENKQWKTNVKYGTVSDYFTEIHKSRRHSKIEYPTYKGDFFPYTDNYYDYWTGFYVSYPKIKRLIRELQEQIHAAKVWQVLAASNNKGLSLNNSIARGLDEAVFQLSILQHHDTITGTSPPQIMLDYKSKAENAISLVQRSMESSLEIDMRSSVGKLRQINSMPEIVSSPAMFVVCNSHTQFREEVVSFKSRWTSFTITDNQGKKLEYQVNPTHYGLMHKLMMNLTMVEVQVKVSIHALSSVVINIKSSSVEIDAKNQSKSKALSSVNVIGSNFITIPKSFEIIRDSSKFTIYNDYMELQFAAQGSIIGVIFKNGKGSFSMKSDVLAYDSEQNSGAYIFKTGGPASKLSKQEPEVYVTSGTLTQQMHVVYPVVKLIFTIFKTNDERAKMISLSCDVHTNRLFQDKEIILRFNSDIANNNTFYTDSNGFQFLRRKFIKNKGIPGNYFPMTTSASIEDASRRFTIHSAQSHGVGSLSAGSLEIMLDRLPTSDDQRGLGQGISKSDPYLAQFSLLFERFDPASEVRITRDNEIFSPSMLSIIANDLLQNPTSLFSVSSNKQSLKRITVKERIVDNISPEVVIVSVKQTTGKAGEIIVNVIVHKRNISILNTESSSVLKYFRKCVRIENIFNTGNPILTVKEMSLNFQDVLHSFQDDSPCVDIAPMTLAAFEIVYKKMS